MPNTVVYVDGFNLYYGLKAKYGRSYLWLDLAELARRMRRGDGIVAVKYFTSIVKNEPDAARRQEIYLEALQTHCPEVQVIRGHFKDKTIRPGRCQECGMRPVCSCAPRAYAYGTFEEKLTDVALATEMVSDAALGVGDQSLLISTDTDFLPALQASRHLAPDRKIYLAAPPGRRRPALFEGLVTAFQIYEQHLAASLLPDEITTAAGKALLRPEKWT